MNDTLTITLLASGITFGTPLLIAALGELLAERSGVLNLGVEGMMLVGAVVAFWTSQTVSGSSTLALVLAVLAAAAAGGIVASLHAFATITMRANQIVSGLALTILCGSIGISTYIGDLAHLSGASGKHSLSPIDVLGLGDLPIVGPLLFHQNILVYLAWALTAVVAWYIKRTPVGLNLRAVGENPKAAEAMSVPVNRYRYCHVIVGGMFAGVAGSVFSLAIAPSWTPGMTAGAGWIAIALVISGFWRPWLVLVGAYFFGVLTSLGFVLQARGVDLAPEIFNAIPYVMTVAVLAFVSATWAKQRFGAPAALGSPYVREDA